MKNWILNHKKLYYFIVGLIAFILFLAITLHGVKRASAATETVTANIQGVEQQVTVYDIFEVDWTEWVSSEDALSHYEVPSALLSKIVSECTQMIVKPYNSSAGGLVYYFLKDAIYEPDIALIGQRSLPVPSDSGYCITVSFASGSPKVQSVAGCYDMGENVAHLDILYYLNGNQGYCVGSTYDFLANVTHENAQKVTRNNLTYPQSLPYWNSSLDSYDRLGNCPEGISVEYLSEGKWKITHEALNDTLGTGAVYPWASFHIALPSLDWIESWEGKTMEEICAEDEIKRWRSGSYDPYITFDILDYIPDDSDKGHVNILKDYFYIDLKSYIADRWSSLYGDLSEEYLDLVIEYAYPNIMVLRSFYVSNGSRVFSPANIVRMYTLSLDMSYNLEFIYKNGGSASQNVLTWVSNAQNQADEEDIINDMAALKTELQKKNELIRELQTQIEWLEAEVTRLLRDSSFDIVEIFDGLVDAITGLPAIFATLGSVIGSVLSFLPGPITALMIAGLGAWIVVSIINAIRGK